jgi:hypothetical protein
MGIEALWLQEANLRCEFNTDTQGLPPLAKPCALLSLTLDKKLSNPYSTPPGAFQQTILILL